MKIDAVSVKKLLVTGLPNLDPLHIYLEDTAPGRGQLVVSCYNKSWTAGWNAMGKDRSVSSFVLACDVSYLVNSLAPGLSSTQFSMDALAKLARQIVIGRRRSSLAPQDSRYDYEPCDKAEARELYNSVDEFRHFDAIHDLPSSAMESLFGEEWWLLAEQATEANPDYVYLSRIVKGIHMALSAQTLAPEQAAPPAIAPVKPRTPR